MEFIKSKTILSKVKYGDDWYGIDYNMNIYRGCSHGCIYCDSRSNCYKIDNFDRVRSKINAIEILEKELSSKRMKGIVGIGAMSDTYNPLEKKYEITRKALELILKHEFGVSIDTKSDLILRDIDLLDKINSRNDVIVKFTVTTVQDELSKIIEPNVCLSSERFRAIKELSNKDIFVGIMMNPVLPFITDTEENIKELVRKAHESGAKFIHTYMSMTLRDEQMHHYYRMLDEYFPTLKDRYLKNYGNRYHCLVPNAKELYKIFTAECDQYGILYHMKDIIKAYKKENKIENNIGTQMSLFD